jgi:DNA-binding NarL/FixJ family response regulator
LIRLVVVEDETLFRLGLQTLLNLNPDLTVVGEAGDGEEALRMVAALKPDVLIMDVNMPKLSGIAALEQLRTAGDLTPVILLSTFDEDEAFVRGMRAGASAFLRKDVPFADLTATIHAALRGERVFRPSITEKAVQRLSARKPAFDVLDLPDPLTKRELEVLRLMAAGLSNREIGEALGAGEGTIKSHVSNVLSKMGVRDRTRAVLRGLELGYI